MLTNSIAKILLNWNQSFLSKADNETKKCSPKPVYEHKNRAYTIHGISSIKEKQLLKTLKNHRYDGKVRILAICNESKIVQIERWSIDKNIRKISLHELTLNESLIKDCFKNNCSLCLVLPDEISNAKTVHALIALSRVIYEELEKSYKDDYQTSIPLILYTQLPFSPGNIQADSFIKRIQAQNISLIYAPIEKKVESIKALDYENSFNAGTMHFFMTAHAFERHKSWAEVQREGQPPLDQFSAADISDQEVIVMYREHYSLGLL